MPVSNTSFLKFCLLLWRLTRAVDVVTGHSSWKRPVRSCILMAGFSLFLWGRRNSTLGRVCGGNERKRRLPSAVPVAEANKVTWKVVSVLGKYALPFNGLSLCIEVGPLEAFEHVCGLTSYPARKIQISNAVPETHRRQRARWKPHPSGPPSLLSLSLPESLPTSDCNSHGNWVLPIHLIMASFTWGENYWQKKRMYSGFCLQSRTGFLKTVAVLHGKARSHQGDGWALNGTRWERFWLCRCFTLEFWRSLVYSWEFCPSGL